MSASQENLVERLQLQLDDRESELKHLLLDLALKDEFAIEQRTQLIRADERVRELEDDLGQARAELAALDAELTSLRACEAELDAVKRRAGYRLLEVVSDALNRHQATAKAARWTARRLAGRPLTTRHPIA